MQAALDRFKKSYPDQASMGKLTFGVLSVEPVGADHLYMIGTWLLEKEQLEDAKCVFTLIRQRVDGSWQTIADHSS